MQQDSEEGIDSGQQQRTRQQGVHLRRSSSAQLPKPRVQALQEGAYPRCLHAVTIQLFQERVPHVPENHLIHGKMTLGEALSMTRCNLCIATCVLTAQQLMGVQSMSAPISS